MQFRVFTYKQDGSLKTIMIDPDEIKDMDPDGPSSIGEYFVGKNFEGWSDHGIVDVIGPGSDMLDVIMVSG